MNGGELPTSLTIRFSLRQRMVYYLFWTLYSMQLDERAFEQFFGVPLKKMYGFEFYVFDSSISYLICFNHHDQLIGVGSAKEWVNSLQQGSAPHA